MKRVPLSEIRVQDISNNSSFIQNLRIDSKAMLNQGFSLIKQNLEDNFPYAIIQSKDIHNFPLKMVNHRSITQSKLGLSSSVEVCLPDKQKDNHKTESRCKRSQSIFKHKSKFNTYIRRQSEIHFNTTTIHMNHSKMKLTLLYKITQQKSLSKIFENNYPILSKLDKEIPEKMDKDIEIEQVVSGESDRRKEEIVKKLFNDNKFRDNDTQHKLQKNIVCMNSLNLNVSSATIKGIKINFNQNIDFPSSKAGYQQNITQNSFIKFVI